jgi:hypothetical protein
MIVSRAVSVIKEGRMRDATAAARELRRHTLDRNGAIFFEIFVDEPRRAIVTVEAYATSPDLAVRGGAGGR